ncbi:MAG: transcription factor FapR [Thermoflavifilum sp.]|nr:transcription factor FapR [Thermoflavifilum sp.]MCL6513333.1 transcription factor FapR [Alicyclobacillus sp.]
MGLKKSERRAALVRYLAENPFATDEQLAERFQVSVATIRLDRAALSIPEARERIRQVAQARHDPVRALEQQEVIGELVELELGRMAVSRLRVGSEHVFARTGITRGHILFAQVNSLATAVMDADAAVTAKSELRFYRPVRLGEVLLARVDVIGRRGRVAKCRATTTAAGQTVLAGWIWVVAWPMEHTGTSGPSEDRMEDE